MFRAGSLLALCIFMLYNTIFGASLEKGATLHAFKNWWLLSSHSNPTCLLQVEFVSMLIVSLFKTFCSLNFFKLEGRSIAEPPLLTCGTLSGALSKSLGAR